MTEEKYFFQYDSYHYISAGVGVFVSKSVSKEIRLQID